MSVFDELLWDNRTLASLPVDSSFNPTPRLVPNACFSLVEPTPVVNPVLVAHSPAALALCGLPPAASDLPEFVQYFSGNKVLPGARPAAHCYCGHQVSAVAG